MALSMVDTYKDPMWIGLCARVGLRWFEQKVEVRHDLESWNVVFSWTGRNGLRYEHRVHVTMHLTDDQLNEFKVKVKMSLA